MGLEFSLHVDISIHALLTESDGGGVSEFPYDSNFNPRSPHGERREWRGPHKED